MKAPTTGQSKAAKRMRKASDLIQKGLAEYRAVRDETAPEDLQAYGGKDYGRHLSLSITNIEQGLLWAGELVIEDLD